MIGTIGPIRAVVKSVRESQGEGECVHFSLQLLIRAHFSIVITSKTVVTEQALSLHSVLSLGADPEREADAGNPNRFCPRCVADERSTKWPRKRTKNQRPVKK